MEFIFCLEETTVAGGHKNVLDLCQGLWDKGHNALLYCVGPDRTNDWYPHTFPVRSFGSYDAMERALCESTQAIKVATWWKTAPSVARAGGGLYFVQDVETSYSAGDPSYEDAVLETYRYPNLVLMTYGRWIEATLRRLVDKPVHWISLGVNERVFYPPKRRKRAEPIVVFHERDHFLKGPALRGDVLRGLQGTGICSIGYSPWQANPWATGHLQNPSDTELADLMRKSLCVLVSSLHEGFCLPALEGMACGLPVVSTYADGNEEFCFHHVNAIMGNTAGELIDGIKLLNKDKDLWSDLSRNALLTAEQYRWDFVLLRLENLAQRISHE